jgi:hypothetical protein
MALTSTLLTKEIEAAAKVHAPGLICTSCSEDHTRWLIKGECSSCHSIFHFHVDSRIEHGHVTSVELRLSDVTCKNCRKRIDSNIIKFIEVIGLEPSPMPATRPSMNPEGFTPHYKA